MVLHAVCNNTWMRKLLYDRDFNLEINSFANCDLEKACLLFENVEAFFYFVVLQHAFLIKLV